MGLLPAAQLKSQTQRQMSLHGFTLRKPHKEIRAKAQISLPTNKLSVTFVVERKGSCSAQTLAMATSLILFGLVVKGRWEGGWWFL